MKKCSILDLKTGQADNQSTSTTQLMTTCKRLLIRFAFCMSDFHLYQSNIQTWYLYFYSCKISGYFIQQQ